MDSNINVTTTITSPLLTMYDKSATTAMLSSSFVNTTPTTTVKFTPALLNGLINKQSGANPNILGSSTHVIPTTTHIVESVDVDDLFDIFIPDVGTIATYPPNPTLSYAPPHAHCLKPLQISTNAATDAVICSSVKHAVDKENTSPNRLIKRKSDNISLRKTLKRCRGPTQAMNKDATALALYATNYMSNFIKANSNQAPTTTLSSPTAATPSHTAASSTNVAATKARPTEGVPWKPQLLNKLKLNVDAAVNTVDKILGIGAIIRNHDGQVVVALSKPVQGCFRSDEMEAKALFHALNWITQLY
ncbi:hypothetical protein F8388_008640 [Cannabis sativa]|uniref:RNase H type-1 domain-containing protein n=1 Tax=Cannabis sativa TaxID=3483 RepID=A0A7J6GGW5_CANSA|nr:hypothetical protein F8388_008640 [Cannabis sativa]